MFNVLFKILTLHVVIKLFICVVLGLDNQPILSFQSEDVLAVTISLLSFWSL